MIGDTEEKYIYVVTDVGILLEGEEYLAYWLIPR